MTDLSDPAQIAVQWQIRWRRWDNNKYTSAYATNYTDAGTVSYAVLYSGDSGQTWRFAQDSTPATPGVRPDGTHLVQSLTYTWNVPTSLYPGGSYILMVEAFRDDRTLHYSYHKQKLFIKR
jgi:hypothetical protein